MSDLTTVQEKYELARAETSGLHLELQKAKAAYDQLVADEERELKGLDRNGREQRTIFYSSEKERLTGQINELTTSRKNSRNRFDEFSGGFFRELDPVEKTAELDDAFPILMFPLRLETRFRS